MNKKEFMEIVERVLDNNTREESPDYWSSVTCVPDYKYEDLAEELWQELEVKREYCTRKEGCVCGGDSYAVRSTCHYWRKK